MDLFKWDPISSGEGDLLLDDIAKSFAASNDKSKNVKAIDFSSIIGNLPPQGFLVKNVIAGSEAKLSLNDNRKFLSLPDAIEPQIAVNGVIQQSHTFDGEHCPLSDRQCSVIESSEISHNSDAGKIPSNSEEGKSTVEEIMQRTTSMQEEPIEMGVDNLQSKNQPLGSELNLLSTNELVHSPTSTTDVLAVVFRNDRTETLKMEDVDSHILSGSENVYRDKTSTNLISENQKHVTMVADGTFTAEECLHSARLGEPEDVAIAEDQVSPLNSCTSDIKDDYLISIRQQTSEVLMDEQESGDADPQIAQPPLDQSISGSAGKCRSKQKRHHPASKLPVQRVINSLAFKKACKTNTEKYRSKRRHHPALLLPFKRSINQLAFKKVRRTKC